MAKTIGSRKNYNKHRLPFSNFMQTAIEVAEQQLESNKGIQEIPIGCVIVDNKTNKIIAKSCNQTIKSNNPTKHAEIICIEKALKKLKTNRLTNCSMYITLEPCAMCAMAISLAKVERLYIGCLSEKTGAVVSNLHIFKRKISNHCPDIYYGIMEKECKQLLKDFFKGHRKQDFSEF